MKDKNEKTIIHFLPKIVIGVLFCGTYFIPIFSFEKAFRLYRKTALDFVGVYQNAILLYSLIAILLTFISLKLSSKYFYTQRYKIGIVLVCLLFYSFACIGIAWDYKILFGNTWLWQEVVFELVILKWFFYIFGLLGVYFHYKYQQLISTIT